MKKYFQLFFLLFTPTSTDTDRSRRERILLVLLATCTFLSLFAVLKSVFDYSILQITSQSTSIPFFTFLIIFFSLGIWFSKKGFAKIISYILIFLILLVAFYISFTWGADLQQALLTYCLLIVMAGILIDSKFSLLLTVLIFFGLQILLVHQSTFINQNHILAKQVPVTSSDISMYGFTLFGISAISWLFNRESEQALKRARESEKSLLQERNNLEKKVIERTEQLRQAQTDKINQLYTFADLGTRVTMILHDLATPINVVSLNLEELRKKSSTSSNKDVQEMKQVLRNTMFTIHKIEDFITATRSSIQNLEIKKMFSVSREIKSVITMLQKKSLAHQVHIAFTAHKVLLFGSSTKLHQVISNLVSNAIDAYSEQSAKEKIITINLLTTKTDVIISVEDQAGGMSENTKQHIFDQFFSTKKDSQHLGIGLSICKEIVENDFAGTIVCETSLGTGTTFTITLPKNIA